MSATPSFERFDYLLRTNKHIERKLVFEVLNAAAQRIGFSNHWYLGFGSMWFGDFRLAHRLLQIDKLISIEREDYAPRAKFNRPFASIEVEPGDSGEILKGIAQSETKGIAPETWQRPVIAWLDYDGYLNKDVVNDIDHLLTNAQANSVILITVNGARGTYRAKRQDGLHQRHELSVGVVEGFLGAGCIDSKYEPKMNAAGNYQDVPEAVFPELLTEAISTYMTHKISSSARQDADGSRLKFVPLFRLHHRDGADMVTVGGAIVSEPEVNNWKAHLIRRPLLGDQQGNSIYCKLDLIPITVKEKIALDECLPDRGSGSSFLDAAKNAGIKLDDEEISKYRKFYCHFPVFAETAI